MRMMVKMAPIERGHINKVIEDLNSYKKILKFTGDTAVIDMVGDVIRDLDIILRYDDGMYTKIEETAATD